MKTVVTYTLEHCVKCMRCVQACPTSALMMVDNRIIVNDDKCLNCAKCIRACHSQGLVAKGSTLEDLKNYDYTVALIPSALVSVCSSLDEAEELFYAIKELGFDEVIDISDVEGQLLEYTRKLVRENNGMPLIASFCPVVNRLIEENYPILNDQITDLNYPSEVAAKAIRDQLKDKGNVGIFNFCECEAKLPLAKYPYGNDSEYHVDHALAIVDILPDIRANLGKGKVKVSFCKEGLQSCNPMMMPQSNIELVADGFDKVNDILDMTEFGILGKFKGLYLYPCFNGCLGGHLLWGNSYINKNNLQQLTKGVHKDITSVNIDEITIEQRFSTKTKDTRSTDEKIAFFQKVNEQLDELPGYDCSACGMQTCRMMAEEIVKGHKELDDCHIIHSRREKQK